MKVFILKLLFLLVNLAHGLSPKCTCAQFCNGTCADTNNGTVTTAPLYRLTPFNVTGIRDKDTGDPAGDLGFFLLRDRVLASCKMPERANEYKCFLAYEPVVRRFYVEIDQRWGPYLFCNPLPFYHGSDGHTDAAHVDTRNFGCFPWLGEGTTPWVPSSGPTSCPKHHFCSDLMNRSVGRELALQKAFNPAHPEIAQYFGGWWYSTPSQAECTGDRRPGDGQTPYCSWRLANESVKIINATCMQHQLMSFVRTNGAMCFDTLPSDCHNLVCDRYYECFLAAVLGCGPKTAKICPHNVTAIPPLPPKVLVDAWKLAFAKEDEAEGGCPSLPDPH